MHPRQFSFTNFQILAFCFHLNRPVDNIKVQQWLLNLTWTSESVAQWQEFYNKANRFTFFDRQGQFETKILPANTKYEDLKVEPCNKEEVQHNTDQSHGESNDSMTSQHTLFLFTLILFVLKTISP
jgi:hypothetical protein